MSKVYSDPSSVWHTAKCRGSNCIIQHNPVECIPCGGGGGAGRNILMWGPSSLPYPTRSYVFVYRIQLLNVCVHDTVGYTIRAYTINFPQIFHMNVKSNFQLIQECVPVLAERG